MTLKEWRESQDLTQDDVARKLGVARSYVCRLELGDRTPSFQVLLKIDAITKHTVTLADLARTAMGG